MAPPSTILQDGTKPCTKCAHIKPLNQFYTTGVKKDKTPKYNSWCRSCISKKQASYHLRTWGQERLQFIAYKRTKSVRSYMGYLIGKARKRNKCEISINYMEELWDRQSGLCALTGWPMTMILGKGVVPTNASIDRIDSSLPYTPKNVQLVCRAANVAKLDLSMAEFIKLCVAVVENRNEKIQNASLAA